MVINHTQENHLGNISGIRKRVIEITSIFKMDLGLEKDINILMGRDFDLNEMSTRN
jgi:hypothetical protein